MASQAGLSLERPQQAEGFEMGAPMSMAEDLVKRLRTHMVVHTTDLGDYGTHSTGYVDPDCEAAADLIEQQSATIAAKDEEIERLRAADPRTSLLTVIADIREKTGVGGKPMLDELADAIAERLTSKERALAEAVEERDRLRDDIRQLWGFGTDELRVCEHCDAWMTIEEVARVEDISLCPREAFGSVKFPDEKCFKHRAWIVKEERDNARAFVAQHGSDSREGK